MSTKRFTVLPNMQEPLAFELADDQGEVLGTFHVTRRPRLDIALGMAQAVQLKNGKREIDQPTLLYVLRELMVEELRNEDGVWEPADDRERWDAIMGSDRYRMDWQLMGEIVIWLSEELTGHPTGAPSPS